MGVNILEKDQFPNKNNDRNIDIIIFELEQCREDERAANSHIVQIVIATVALLAIILAIFSPVSGGLTVVNEQKINLVVPFVIALLSGASAFIATTGLLSALRHHYTKYLENSLSKFTQNEILHWESLSTSIKNLNPYHIRSLYSSLYFANTVVTIFSALILCILFISIFSNCIETKVVLLSLVIWFPSLTIVFFAWVFGTSKSRQLYNHAKKDVVRRGNDSETENERKEFIKKFLQTLRYFILPRPTDLQKSLFLIFGIVIGMIYNVGNFSTFMKYVLYSIFIIEILTYQVRYQLNDIRGIKEDTWKTRLPFDLLKKRWAIIISLIVGFYKLILAIAISLLSPESMHKPFIVGIILIFILGVIYEIIREKEYKSNHKKKAIFWVFALIPFGYLLRFFIGLLIAYPSFFLQFKFTNLVNLSVLFVIFSIIFFSEVFVGITWALEASHLKSNLDNIVKKEKIDIQIKPHYIWLVDKVKDWGSEFPLKQKGHFFVFWNYFMILSMSCILCALILVSSFSLFSLGLIVLMWLTTLIACLKPYLKFKLILLFISLSFALVLHGFSSILLIYCLAAVVYFVFFVMFRNSNYMLMNNILENIKNISKKIYESIVTCILGKNIFMLLKKKISK